MILRGSTDLMARSPRDGVNFRGTSSVRVNTGHGNKQTQDAEWLELEVFSHF